MSRRPTFHFLVVIHFLSSVQNILFARSPAAGAKNVSLTLLTVYPTFQLTALDLPTTLLG